MLPLYYLVANLIAPNTGKTLNMDKVVEESMNLSEDIYQLQNRVKTSFNTEE